MTVHHHRLFVPLLPAPSITKVRGEKRTKVENSLVCVRKSSKFARTSPSPHCPTALRVPFQAPKTTLLAHRHQILVASEHNPFWACKIDGLRPSKAVANPSPCRGPRPCSPNWSTAFAAPRA